MSAVSLKNVTKRYDALTAIRDFSLEISEASVFGLLGPNGAGKTTTIRMVMNIIAPDEGEIVVLGRRMEEATKDRIGYLPEERGLYGKMKVLDQLVFLGGIKSVPKEEARRRAEDWLGRLELSEWGDRLTADLSRGMQQKGQFIATVLHDPDLVVLDEPFAGLDPINTDLLRDIMLDLKEKGKTIIFSTHLMEHAERICDAICLINRGAKVLDGRLSEIKRRYGRNTVVMEFDGDEGFLNNSDLVKRKNWYGRYVEIQLQEKVDPQDLLKIALAKAKIRRFELAEPSLHDIFVEEVSGADEQSA